MSAAPLLEWTRDKGMGLAADAEDRAQPDFAERAYAAICAVALRQSTVHVDDVLKVCFVKPHHANAWGAVWVRAIKTGVIERTGTVRPCMTDIKKHKHQYPIYRSTIYGRAA